jgi:hypothetical protein
VLVTFTSHRNNSAACERALSPLVPTRAALLSLRCTPSARSVVTCDRKEQPVRDQHQQGDFLKSVPPILDGEFANLKFSSHSQSVCRASNSNCTLLLILFDGIFLHNKNMLLQNIHVVKKKTAILSRKLSVSSMHI